MKERSLRRVAVLSCVLGLFFSGSRTSGAPPKDVDAELQAALRRAGFTGAIQSTLERRLGRQVDPQLADLGRLLWFDKAGGLPTRPSTRTSCGTDASRLPRGTRSTTPRATRSRCPKG